MFCLGIRETVFGMCSRNSWTLSGPPSKFRRQFFFFGGDGFTLPNSQQQWNKLGIYSIFPNFFSAQGKILLFCYIKKLLRGPLKETQFSCQTLYTLDPKKTPLKKIAPCFSFFSFKKQKLDILFF